MYEDRIDEIIIPTPYDDRGCYNCKYRMILKNSIKDYCEIHKYEVSAWKWCEGWELQK